MANQIWFQKYLIIRPLGKGGSAEVFLAEHIKLHTLRAIKRISKNHILHGQLLHEANILKNLKHPCIPVIYDVEEDNSYSYIIEQYIEGESLSEFRESKGRLPEQSVIEIAAGLCDLFSYLYSLNNPILYLDLKPDNLIISDGVVRLIDFGASVPKKEVHKRSFSLGTKGYAAPELYTKTTPDERTDIYGIGALLYYIVTGYPYELELGQAARKNLELQCSKALANCIQRCLRANSSFRYPSVAALNKKLSELKRSKVSSKEKSNETLHIAVAGTQQRIGTTHLAFLLTSYLCAHHKNGLYIEKNKSGQLHSLLSRYQNNKTRHGVHRLFGCNLLPETSLENAYNKELYPFTVMDFGCLTKENITDFLEADHKLIVSGGKEWELQYTEEILKQIEPEEDIRFLFNYLNGKQYALVAGAMGQFKTSRIPYEPDPFKGKGNEYVMDFISNLLYG
ncbi:hypothetical protein acsn021_42930 [Anaerocolumna cellulosilytica]|uniref:non-specific serine/threonine protein kinase n=1 Tax=Anaerocolumna cellulosilytica TaxID=433286 RepID=A0A6S6R1E9_9FIRM|nr:serine/threonine-protein kinase [Anaerocolumna cellulosilytica]MBB5195251.1 serine/threonine-protein kinase [Anaerocolumna cellulosilytica]BCJ96724.1 hypothetical protein acsn021_42930 [Anaerocolumna cellulosilytica]